MKTSCFKDYPGDMGVAICLYPPIDWTGLRFPSLAPDTQIFYAIKNKSISREQYIQQYNEHILGELDPAFIYKLFERNVLLCWEPPGEFCHRRLVAAWIQDKLGIEVPEWSHKDEILKKDSNSVSLF